MKQERCPNCGGSDFTEKDGYRICKYCDSKFKIEPETEISLLDDIERLLRKCKTDPKRARKYASLVLDLDPTNKEARKYLK